MDGRDFRIFAPLTFFQKANAPAGQKRRIAGVISTELKDKQDEVVLQRGLDFSPFLKGGWFNDNHSQKTTDVLGYPDKVLKFKKGETLPDGTVAPTNGTWSEGYLLDTPEAQKVWDLGLALQKAGSDRRLGFSIEGKVLERQGPGGKTVAKALVRNVAITNVPVGEGTRMEALAKSMRAVEDQAIPEDDDGDEDDTDLEKMMTMGAATPGVAPVGPRTGAGVGAILTPKHLEGQPKKQVLDKSLAVAHVQNRLGCDQETAERAYSTLLQLKQRGLL